MQVRSWFDNNSYLLTKNESRHRSRFPPRRLIRLIFRWSQGPRPKRQVCSIITRNRQTTSPRTNSKTQASNSFVLSQNPEDLAAKAELLALVQKAKDIFEECGIQNKVEPVLGDAVKAAGIGFLLASNCFKDVGAVLLITDSIIEDPSDVTNDVIVLIFVALLGRQAYADCQQFIGYVLWSVHLIWFISTHFFNFA